MTTRVQPFPPPVTNFGAGEQEPLLGRPEEEEEIALGYYLVTGTAFIAQLGGIALVLVVYISVYSHDMCLFSVHPLLNALGIALLLESTLLLQPTHSSVQKHKGAIIHSVLNSVAFILMYSAFIVVVVSKVRNQEHHFGSAHAILGLITYILLFMQATFGMIQFYFPSILGGEAKAKEIYKYHRMSGYVIFLFILSTAVAVTYVPYVHDVLKIRTWVVIVAGVLILGGVLPRADLGKFGFKQG
ncbi:hypothetical protein ABKN59_008279 [Abortiporus biennis]